MIGEIVDGEFVHSLKCMKGRILVFASTLFVINGFVGCLVSLLTLDDMLVFA